MIKILRKALSSRLFLSAAHLLSYCLTSLSALAYAQNNEDNTKSHEPKYNESSLLKELISLDQHQIDMSELANQANNNLKNKRIT